jgi:integrase
MASLQCRNDFWRLLFRHDGKQYSYPIGPVPQTEATTWKGRIEHTLMRLDQGLLDWPPGISLIDFLKYDGKPPADPALSVRKDTTLDDLSKQYLATVSNGAIEASTLATAKIHLAHMETTFGKRFLLSGLTLVKLQGHIDRRIKSVSPITIKKEIASFRAAWNWGHRAKLVPGEFPSRGLIYPKSDESLPYMTWKEIERRVKAGGNPKELWEALFLNVAEIEELLKHVKQKTTHAWVYPMIAMAAHTGARRSELIAARKEDVDLAESVITIREKKRQQGTRTSRRVPISGFLAKVLKPLLDGPGPYLFGDGNQPLPRQATQEAFVSVRAKSKWSVLKGYHVLRHSFISACAAKNVDQRLLDSWVGHQTEEQRRRYRHLYPSVQEAALRSVFG